MTALRQRNEAELGLDRITADIEVDREYVSRPRLCCCLILVRSCLTPDAVKVIGLISLRA